MKLRHHKRTMKLRRAQPAKVGFRPSAYGCSGWECFFTTICELPGRSVVLFTGCESKRYAEHVFNLIAERLDLVLIQKRLAWAGSMRTIPEQVQEFLQWVFKAQLPRREIPTFKQWRRMSKEDRRQW